MKIKEFIKELQRLNPEAQILVSCDEELNTIYEDIGISYLADDIRKPYEPKIPKIEEIHSKVVIWGNSGSEVE